MTDADLIYNACLRAEKRLEAIAKSPVHPDLPIARAALLAVQTLREEIGTGMTKESR